MSWLARSIANSLRIDDDNTEDEEEDEDEESDVVPNQPHDPAPSSPSEHAHQDQREQHEPQEDQHNDALLEEAQSRGVKEDLSELKQTLTRQLWGVASFLAPHPSEPSKLSRLRHSDRSFSPWHQFESSDQSVSGGEYDPSESDYASEISKMASNSMPFGSEGNEDFEGVVGITDEVLAFASNVAMHPETWLDFPLYEEEDLDDFDMSDAQQDHVLAIQRLAPRLAALRIELCPCHLTESYFWKVYFVLLHSRLNKHDADALSTSQVVAARAMWMQELQKQTKQVQKQTKEEMDWFARSTSCISDRTNILEEDFVGTPSSFAFESTTSSMLPDYGTDKDPVESTELQFIDKSVIAEKPVNKTEYKDSSKQPVQNFEDDEDDWLEEDPELGGYSGATISIGNEEDISFSDLEDDDECRVPIKSNIVVSKG